MGMPGGADGDRLGPLRISFALSYIRIFGAIVFERLEKKKSVARPAIIIRSGLG